MNDTLRILSISNHIIQGERVTDLSKLQSARPQLTTGRLMLLVAIAATCFAVYVTTVRFSAVTRSASTSAGATAALAWCLAAALPALWVGAVRRTPPDGLLARFAIGNGFIAILVGFMGAPLFVSLVAASIGVPSLGWYAMSQMGAGEGRDRLRGRIMGFLSYVVQFTLTVVLFIASIPLLEWIL
jgi:hypothetical protein